ncbi:hypothetical protein AAJ76_500085842 [Vairimorpha ceranae]|uniref:Uncharacterized protein n=1 Tax=Vairimorpha ceranae TaxID=40302 RepID=A0A0F9WI39_9MICR|nr:hypothetical protein AAJ76_500085842 [Vairimorpha ceranae]KAF5141016.1 hypothetical protein G9O61_00g008600 [Vairimorpha ceranae]KAF5141507.1 hypothetical protein G9O61_00g003710 [Vairimorpha ceranae]KKO76255.1 hypothetical protein AAJ76_500085842 [Vairimorpha ceranae]
MIPIFFFTLIKGEITTGFVIENGKQLLELKLDKKLVAIHKSFLLEKQKNSDEFVTIKKMNNHTRFIRNKDEYESYKEELIEKNEKLANSDNLDEDSDSDPEFEEIYVDINNISKQKGKIYGVSVEYFDKKDKKIKVYSRPFTYSAKEKQWVLGDVPIDDKESSKWWTYGGIALLCVCAIGIFAYFLS